MDAQLVKRVFTTVATALNSIYKKRKRTLFFQKVMWGVTGIFLVPMLLNMLANYFPNLELGVLDKLWLFNNNPYTKMYPLIGLMIVIYSSTYFFAKIFSKLKIQERAIISKMVKTLFPMVDFTFDVPAPFKEVKRSKLFAWIKPDSQITSYGQIRNNSEGKVINIADIGIVEKLPASKFLTLLERIPVINLLAVLYVLVAKNIFTNKTTDNIHYTFRGIFCWLDFKKPLQGHTVVLTNNQRTRLSGHFTATFKKEQKIQLEDPRFTNQFIVYSTNQVEAYYVLSTVLMERITVLKEKFNTPILLSFQNKQMCFAVQNEHGLFSFPDGKLNDIEIVQELSFDIETCLNIDKLLKVK